MEDSATAGCSEKWLESPTEQLHVPPAHIASNKNHTFFIKPSNLCQIFSFPAQNYGLIGELFQL